MGSELQDPQLVREPCSLAARRGSRIRPAPRERRCFDTAREGPSLLVDGLYMNNSKTSPLNGSHRPLALHLRRFRQWCGDHGLRQVELAFLAGVSVRLIRKYEAARELPRAVEALVAMSLVLDVPLEQLIATDRINTLRSAIAERREMFGTLPQLTGRHRAHE